MKWMHLQLLPSAAVVALMMSTVLPASANAQAPSPTQAPTAVTSDQALAISVHNPFEDSSRSPSNQRRALILAHITMSATALTSSRYCRSR